MKKICLAIRQRTKLWEYHFVNATIAVLIGIEGSPYSFDVATFVRDDLSNTQNCKDDRESRKVDNR